MSLHEVNGRTVPDILKDVAVTVTEINHAQNEIQFVVDGRSETWPFEGVKKISPRPLTIGPELKRWLERSCPEPLCGHITKDNGYCSWPAPCRLHQKRERCVMQREDELSKQADKGICGITQRNGRICMNVRGECKVHAPKELRCTSMLDCDTTLRCWLHKEENSDYCISHAEFPNLSINAKEYGIECYNRSQPCSLKAFLERYYPSANAKLFPFLDGFSAYVKGLSGHVDEERVEVAHLSR